MDIDETPSESTCAKCQEEIRYQANLDPVHWIRNNMSQWYQICSDFSSSDPDKQRAAYKHLLTLNSRYATDIPSGMKCTLNFLKARLQDKMFAAHIVENQLADDVEVLRDMYMSAIQEFLDILASTSHLSNGIYPLSRKFDLPDWLVEIYHEMCHGEKKPSIQKLRAAAHLCIDWLRDKYWINESEMASIWMKVELKVKDEIRQMVTALNKCLAHYFEGNRVISSIPDESLRKYVEARCKKYDISELLKMRQKLVKKKLLEEKDVSVSFLVLVKDITEYFKQDSYIHIVENFAEVLLEGNCFLPSKDLLIMLDPMRYNIDESLPLRFLKVWNGIFEFLPQKQFIPALIQKLLDLTNNVKECEQRRGIAAIWIKILANSLAAVRDTLRLMKRKLLSGKQGQENLRRAFESQLMQKVAGNGNVIRLRPQEVPAELQQFNSLKRVLLPSANKWTRVYLQSLMLLLEPRLPKKLEITLDQLVCIYTEEYSDSPFYEELTIRSVEDLNGLWKKTSKHANMDVDGDNNHNGVPWVHDVEKWGSDPHHHELRILTDDLPGASLWQSDFKE